MLLQHSFSTSVLQAAPDLFVHEKHVCALCWNINATEKTSFWIHVTALKEKQYDKALLDFPNVLIMFW